MNAPRREMTPLAVLQAFVERINAGDVAGLAALMTEDHRFIDSLGNVVSGREAMSAGWVGYFGMVPDYRLTAEQWLCDGSVVVMLGTAGGTYSPDRTLQPERRWTNEPIRRLMRPTLSLLVRLARSLAAPACFTFCRRVEDCIPQFRAV